MERFAKKAAAVLSEALKRPFEMPDLEFPLDRSLGDFAIPCFKLSKEFKKSPPETAKEVVEKIKTNAEWVSRLGGIDVVATGPYVNFKVPADQALQSLLQDILTGEGYGLYGALTERPNSKWIIEFSSPNVAKPMHVGHLRTTVFGAALSRVGRYRGFDVVAINHLGDWGTQFGKMAVAIDKYAGELPGDATISDLLKLYVKFHTECEKDAALEDQAREAFRKLEQGDPRVRSLWQRCLDISMKEYERIYGRLDVRFDRVWGESFYQPYLAPLLSDLKQRGILVESEGAWVVFVKDENKKDLTPCILQKKDGSTIYATRDVAAAIYRWEQFKFDRMSYITGGEQKLHFQQVFAVLRQMGHEWAQRCEHVPFGLYRFKDAKLSTRKGNAVTLDEVLEVTRGKVAQLIHDREKAQDIPDLESVIEAVAIGAVVFFDLSTDPAKDVQFDLERVTDFEGETGPYLQYAHTRCLSILRKAHDEAGLVPRFDAARVALLKAPEEIALVKRFGLFALCLERVLHFSKPSQLANYLIDVTKDFGAFYRECRVIGEERELSEARLMLVEATRRIVGRGLELLGIPRPERM